MDTHSEARSNPVPHIPATHWLIIVLLVIVAGTCIAMTLTTYGITAPRWEYKIEGINDYSFDRQMNALGKEGWELVFARRAKASDSDSFMYECIFKRKQMNQD